MFVKDTIHFVVSRTRFSLIRLIKFSLLSPSERNSELIAYEIQIHSSVVLNYLILFVFVVTLGARRQSLLFPSCLSHFVSNSCLRIITLELSLLQLTQSTAACTRAVNAPNEQYKSEEILDSDLIGGDSIETWRELARGRQAVHFDRTCFVLNVT